jgi:hypothetical protein
MVTSLKMMDFDENLPIINKTNHQTKGAKEYKMEGPKSWQTKNPPKRVVDHKRN